MPLTNIRAQILALMEATDTVSKVYDYERWTNDPNSLISLFKPAAGDTHFRAWIFKPYSIAEFTLTSQDVLIVYLFLVRFVMSVKDADATEKTASDLIETMRTAFRQNSNLQLGNTCETIATSQGPLAGRSGLQLDKLDFIKLGGVLCHYAELKLAAQEVIARPA